MVWYTVINKDTGEHKEYDNLEQAQNRFVMHTDVGDDVHMCRNLSDSDRFHSRID